MSSRGHRTLCDAAGLSICKLGCSDLTFESNQCPCLQIPVQVVNIWLRRTCDFMSKYMQVRLCILTVTHTLSFNLALFNIPLLRRFAYLILCNCYLHTEPLCIDTQLHWKRSRLPVGLNLNQATFHALPRPPEPHVHSDHRDRGENCWFIFLLWADKWRWLPLKASGYECAGGCN